MHTNVMLQRYSDEIVTRILFLSEMITYRYTTCNWYLDPPTNATGLFHQWEVAGLQCLGKGPILQNTL